MLTQLASDYSYDYASIGEATVMNKKQMHNTYSLQGHNN